MTNPTLATLRRIAETAESGQWPLPTEIDALRAAHEESLELGQEFKGRSPLIELPPDKRNALFEWTDRGMPISHALHALAALAGLSIQETTELVGGSPPAWGRLRARAALAEGKSRRPDGGKADRESGKADNWKASGFPGWSEWHNWGFGLDPEGRWHLFHFRRPTGPMHVGRWIHHRRAVVSFAEGLMTELAMKLAEEGVIREHDFVRKINPEVSGLRKYLRKIVEAEGHCLQGDPLARNNEHRLWRPKARFGRASKRDRAWLFDPTEP